MQAVAQRSVNLLGPVLEVDLGEGQADDLRVRLIGGAGVATPAMTTSFSLTIRYSCWPLPALRWVIVRPYVPAGRARLEERRGGLVDAVLDG